MAVTVITLEWERVDARFPVIVITLRWERVVARFAGRVSQAYRLSSGTAVNTSLHELLLFISSFLCIIM